MNRLNTVRNSHGSVAAQVVKLNKQHGIHVDLGSLVAPECTKVRFADQMYVLELEMDELMELITGLGKCSSLLYEEAAESDNFQELDDDGSQTLRLLLSARDSFPSYSHRKYIFLHKDDGERVLTRSSTSLVPNIPFL